MADAEPTVVSIHAASAGTIHEAEHQIEGAGAKAEQDATATAGTLNPSRGENDKAGASHANDEARDGLPTLRIKDIRVGKEDSRGLPITYIYATQSDEYAIYQAGEVKAGKMKLGEVMVQFADEPPKAAIQRKSILPVSSARAEINVLVQGLACRKICDRQVAYALQLALDGEIEGAKVAMAGAKNFVLAKRSARGRFQYLKWSFGTAAMLITLLCVAGYFLPLPDVSSDLWLAGKAGLVGAAFSIALAIRNRTVALDIDLLDNVTDGTLRLLIGVISAGLLLLLLDCGVLPNLQIGEANLSAQSLTWQIVLVVGFLGGFLERLVPDLLEKKNPLGNGNNIRAAPASSIG